MDRRGCCFIIILFLARLASAQAVTVEKHPPVIEIHRFDPAHPPASMPALEPDTRAQTLWAHNCSTFLRCSLIDAQRQPGGVRVNTQIISASIKLDLTITLWLPQDCSARLREHEEGHRAIAERIYQKAETAARAAAGLVIGKHYSADGPDREAALQKCIDQASKELGDSYVQRVNGPTSRASQAYDRLTAHGRNTTPTTTRAVEQAIEETSKP